MLSLELSDAALVGAVAEVLATPRAQPSSFIIHAPLELLARAALLRGVALSAREAARQRVLDLATEYLAQPGSVSPAPVRAFDSTEDALRRLTSALDAGEVEDVDAAASWLITQLDVRTLRRSLLPAVVAHAGLAAHAPILFAELGRTAERFDGLAGLLRAPLRFLSATKSRVSTNVPPGPLDAATLAQRLRHLPRVKSASTSIAPTLAAVSELAPEVLRGLDSLTALDVRRVLLRVAAQSMLEDDSQHAPYGWSHCLTLPLGVLDNLDSLSDPAGALVVAATHVVAFRATLSKVDLSDDWAPSAELRCRYAPAERCVSLERLATFAALHSDAHLVKYTRACLDAAAFDPEAELLFFSAAEHLADWWRSQAAA
jgi:hypothetical protein